MSRTLLDRPLRRDALLRTYAFVVVVAALLSGRDKVELGGAFNPDRLASFASDFVDVALGAALLTLVPLLVRYVLRRARRPEADASVDESPVHSQRPGEWTNAAALRVDVGGQPGEDADGAPAVRRRAPELRADLDAVITFAGHPVELTWKAPRADHVLISTLPGQHPSSGTAALHLEHGTDVVVTAVNQHGYRVVRTPYVRVLPMPTLTVMAVAAPPPIVLTTNVRVETTSALSVAGTLERVLDEQALRRNGKHPLPEPVMTVAEAVGKLRDTAAGAAGWRPDHKLWSQAPAPIRLRRTLTGVPAWLSAPRRASSEPAAVDEPVLDPDTILPGFSAYGGTPQPAPASDTPQGRFDR